MSHNLFMCDMTDFCLYGTHDIFIPPAFPYVWVMSHMNESYHIWLSHVTQAVYMWYESFLFVWHTWNMCHMYILIHTATYSYRHEMSHATYKQIMWHDSFVNELCHMWMSHATYKQIMWHDSHKCHYVTWLTLMTHTHAIMWHDSHSWLCDMTHTHATYKQIMWHDSHIWRIFHICHTNICVIQGGEDSYDPLSLWVIFRKSDLYLVALLWKMTCNLGEPMSLRHPVCIYVFIPPYSNLYRKRMNTYAYTYDTLNTYGYTYIYCHMYIHMYVCYMYIHIHMIIWHICLFIPPSYEYVCTCIYLFVQPAYEYLWIYTWHICISRYTRDIFTYIWKHIWNIHTASVRVCNRTFLRVFLLKFGANEYLRVKRMYLRVKRMNSYGYTHDI